MNNPRNGNPVGSAFKMGVGPLGWAWSLPAWDILWEFEEPRRPALFLRDFGMGPPSVAISEQGISRCSGISGICGMSLLPSSLTTLQEKVGKTHQKIQ